jgi:DNA-binding transcriptional LysR family regulator
MRLTHRQVEIFRALMTAGSVTKAAEMLFTSQPTVSRELARMEQLIGVALFERTRGRLHPTMPALTLFEEVKQAYAGLERVVSVAAGLRDAPQGPLTVLALPAFSHSLLPRACRHFHVKHPEVGVSIATQEAPLLGEWLTAQRYDLGLTEDDVAPPGTRLTPLLEVDEVCVLPAGHPLLKKAAIRLEDFAGQPFISLSPADAYRKQLDEMFAARGIQRRMIIETPSAVSVCSLVKQGLGVAMVNPVTALELEGVDLHIRPLVEPYPFRVSIVQPEYKPLNPAVAELVTALRLTAAEIADRLATRG